MNKSYKSGLGALVLSVFLLLGQSALASSGKGSSGKGGSAGDNVVRIENTLPKAQIDDGNSGKQNDALAAGGNGDNSGTGNAGDAAGAAMIFEMNEMVGNDLANGGATGVQGDQGAMSVKKGSGKLDDNMDLQVAVEGVQDAAGFPANGVQLQAGVSCLDAGVFTAQDNSGQGTFTLDENGNGEFKGHIDINGGACVAPNVVVMDDKGQMVAMGGHAAGQDNQGNQGSDAAAGGDKAKTKGKAGNKAARNAGKQGNGGNGGANN